MSSLLEFLNDLDMALQASALTFRSRQLDDVFDILIDKICLTLNSQKILHVMTVNFAECVCWSKSLHIKILIDSTILLDCIGWLSCRCLCMESSNDINSIRATHLDRMGNNHVSTDLM